MFFQNMSQGFVITGESGNCRSPTTENRVISREAYNFPIEGTGGDYGSQRGSPSEDIRRGEGEEGEGADVLPPCRRTPVPSITVKGVDGEEVPMEDVSLGSTNEESTHEEKGEEGKGGEEEDTPIRGCSRGGITLLAQLARLGVVTTGLALRVIPASSPVVAVLTVIGQILRTIGGKRERFPIPQNTKGKTQKYWWF